MTPLNNLWMAGELPNEALTVIEHNAASTVMILEERAVMTVLEQQQFDVALEILVWVEGERARRAR